MNIILGNMSHNASLGPMTGLTQDKQFVTRVKPLYFISEKETRLFCFLKNFDVHFSECPNIQHSFRAELLITLSLQMDYLTMLQRESDLTNTEFAIVRLNRSKKRAADSLQFRHPPRMINKDIKRKIFNKSRLAVLGNLDPDEFGPSFAQD